MKGKLSLKIIDSSKLFYYGKIADGYLVVNNMNFENSFIKNSDLKNNLFLEQLKKATNKEIDYCAFIMDFSNVNNIFFDEYLTKIPNGIIVERKDKNLCYKDFLKSNSMSKESELLYLNEELYFEMSERINLGLISDDDISLSKWYAYTGLSLSDIDVTNKMLTEEEVLFVDDEKKIINTSCVTGVSVQYLKELQRSSSVIDKEKIKAFCDNINEIKEYANRFSNSDDAECAEIRRIIDTLINLKNDNTYNIPESEGEIYWVPVYVNDFPIEVNCFDGEGLIDLEFANEIIDDNKKYTGATSFQIRYPFIKGVVHSVDFKLFCHENGVTKIKDYYSNEEKDIEKIKLILTKSQFKANMFIKNDKRRKIKYYFKKIKEYGYCLGIASINPENKGKVNLSYQMLSTMPVDYEEWKRKKQNDILEDFDIKKGKEYVEEALSTNSFYKKEKEVFDTSKDFFYSTNSYANLVSKIYKNMKRNYLMGKIPISGCMNFLSGDLLELLFHAVNKEYDDELKIKEDSFYLPNIDYEDGCYTILRSPHYLSNEICILNKGQSNDLREKYFSHLKGVLMINSLSLVAQRLGGADFDGDEIVLVKDKTINEFESRAKGLPLILIPSLEAKINKMTYENKVECLKNTFNSRVGIISNKAFIDVLNSKIKNKKSGEEIFSINKHWLCIYTILSGLEIDSAKSGKKPFIGIKELCKNKYFSSIIKDYLTLKKRLEKENDLNDIAGYLNGRALEKDELYLDSFVFEFEKEIFNVEIPMKKDIVVGNYDKYPTLISKEDIIDDDEALKIRAMIHALSDVRMIIRKYRKDEFKNNGELIRIITKCLNRNYSYIEYDFYDYINNVKVDYPKKSFELYFNSKTKFHFLKNFDEKKEFLRSIGVDVSEKYINVLCDFSNDGYKLLYLTLFYKIKNMNRNIYEYDFDFEKITPPFDGPLFTEEKKRIYLNKYTMVKNKVSQSAYPYANDKRVDEYDILNIILDDVYIGSGVKYEIDGILPVVDLRKDEVAFALFYKELCEWLRRRG